VIAEHMRQPVEGNAAAQMMHVMNADIGREPAQHMRQVVMRRTVKRRLVEAPAVVPGPERLSELMLHVEEPDADRSGEDHDGRMHHQKCLHADQPHEPRRDRDDRGIGGLRADPGPPARTHQPDRQALLQQEHIGRPDDEEHDRMAVEPVFEPAPPGARQIFAHGERIDVADAAPVEIAAARVMKCMRPPPEIVRRHREYAEHATDPVVGQLARKEGAVAAIVLNREEPHQKSGGRNRDQQRQPPEAEIMGRPGAGPERNEGERCYREFPDAARKARIAIARENLHPVACGQARRVDIMSDAQDV